MRVLSSVQNLCNLLVIAAAVLTGLLKGQRRARFAAPGRIADHRGEITDDENDLMRRGSCEHTQLAERDGMAKVQVADGSGRRRA